MGKHPKGSRFLDGPLLTACTPISTGIASRRTGGTRHLTSECREVLRGVYVSVVLRAAARAVPLPDGQSQLLPPAHLCLNLCFPRLSICPRDSLTRSSQILPRRETNGEGGISEMPPEEPPRALPMLRLRQQRRTQAGTVSGRLSRNSHRSIRAGPSPCKETPVANRHTSLDWLTPRLASELPGSWLPGSWTSTLSAGSNRTCTRACARHRDRHCTARRQVGGSRYFPETPSALGSGPSGRAFHDYDLLPQLYATGFAVYDYLRTVGLREILQIPQYLLRHVATGEDRPSLHRAGTMRAEVHRIQVET